MQKIQILFPEPTLAQLRLLAKQEDRPVSELVRQAIDRYLAQRGTRPKRKEAFPTFRGGRVKVSAEEMRELLYEDDAL